MSDEEFFKLAIGVAVGCLIGTIVICMAILLSSCTTSTIKDCKLFCGGDRTELFKDNDLECKCVNR